MVRGSLIALAVILGAGAALAAPQGGGQPGGMTLLTDGTKMDNFDQAGNANWHTAERTITADRGNGFLVTKQSYQDFRLRAEVWVDDIANSGIFIRCDGPALNIGGGNCYEVNIFDTRPDPSYGTGAIVNVAKVNPMPKAGLNWNVMEIEAKGDQMTIKLNGKQTVVGHDAKHARGRIGFQYGGGVVRWRKIEIQPL